MRHVQITIAAFALLSLPARATEETSQETPPERQSYEMGVAFGRSLGGQGLDLDADALARGLRDGLAAGRAAAPAAESAAAARGVRAGRRASSPVPPAEARRRGEAFLAENAKKEGVVTLRSGVQYKVLKQGDGPRPIDADWVTCNYRGTLVDGTEFESSYERGRPATLPVARVVPGLREALKLMPVGSKWQIAVPARLGYGEQGGRRKRRAPGGIGPNETLVFEAELVGMQSMGAPEAPQETTAAAAAPAARGN